MSINVNVGNFIPTSVLEVGNEISVDQLAAITAANSPSAVNPFSTVNHIHVIGNITGLQTALDTKALLAHTHIVGDITGLQNAIDSKSSVGHVHGIGEVTDLPAQLDGKVPEAPLNTNQYARQNGAWTVVTGGVDLSGYAPLESPTFTTRIYTPAVRNILNADLVVDSYNDTGTGTHYLHKFNPFDGRFYLAPNGGGLVFPDATIQSTASYSKAQSDANLTTVAGWVDAKASKSGDTFTGKVSFTASAGGVAGINIGIGGTPTASTENGDIWIPTLGTNLNFRDGNGIARVCASTTSGNTFNQPQSVDTSNTLPAFRVTQRGTGQAILIEDSTTPDITSFVVSNNGCVGIGVDNTFVGNVSLNVYQGSNQYAGWFRRLGADNGHPTVIIDGFTSSSTALKVSNGLLMCEDSGIKIGPFGNTTRATITNIQQTVTATGTYDKEIPITIDGISYRIPCRQV